MRRASAFVVGVARPAAAGSIELMGTGWQAASNPVDCIRQAWLHRAAQPGTCAAATTAATPASAATATPVAASSCTPAAAAALLAAPRCASTPTRSFSSSPHPQHNAQPAHAEEANAAAAAGAGAPAAAERQYERNCWQCGTRLGDHDLFFCPECQSVQPASMDVQYFKVFDIYQPTFDLDVSQLEQQYKQLQRRLHPDKYSTASALEQDYAHQQAAVVNQAYDVLKRPLRRAHYILNQAGYGACEGMTITDPELLMYVMEAREEVESTTDTARLQQLQQENQALEQRCIKGLLEAFGAGDMQHAAELTTQLRYICRIREAIMEKL